MNKKKYTEANRIAWNEAMPYHQKAKDGKFFRAFLEPGYSCLDETITAKIKEIGITGRDAAQLGCNDGREILSLKNLGAQRAVGFDISDAAIAEARKLAKVAKIECEFVRTDIYEIPEEYNDSFDLIYISIGVLPWMLDLESFFKIVSRLIRKNGILLIYETHPIMQMFDSAKKDVPMQMTESYFRKDPWVDTTSLDYYDNTQYDASVHYDFPHTLSEIINNIIRQGLTLAQFEEYPHDTSLCYKHLENGGIQLPMSCILVAHK